MQEACMCSIQKNPTQTRITEGIKLRGKGKIKLIETTKIRPFLDRINFKMCSTGGDDGDNLLEPKPRLLQPGTICRKCKFVKAQVVLQIRDAYCKDCFLALCNHKFRALLGKSRVFDNKPKSALIAFSGSASSLALSKLLSDAVAAGPSHRRIMADPKIIHIEEGSLLDLSSEDRLRQCSEIKSAAAMFGFPVYCVPLNIGGCLPVPIDNYKIDKENDTKVQEMFHAIKDASSKIDFLSQMRYEILANCARKLDTSLVMLADSSTSVAVKILSGVALGRGASIGLETGFSDTRHPDITILRPLRDFSSKEAAIFCSFSGCSQPVFIPSLLTMSEADSSIQRLTEDFIITLQNEFPSTVSTIYRTGEKFRSLDSNSICALCLGPKDTCPKACSAIEATDFSRKLSTGGKKETGSCSSCNCKSSVSQLNLMQALCYSCRLLARSMEKPDLMPSSVIERVKESQSFSEMRSQIEEFLITDE
ncbi:cytoplasmic tRNA 2-thiolation protein 2 [Neocloeon triangulifer]|uniref:cytoplasmic tRNA 2-thiolation protein 2 n=1 Tax=Neocloeon triangulifer TaxID=2078957 RepID=UPI00286FA42A|nr:cytoplasmic tRNA 2-thiolation protein 2 [Neocloeon triangulifer]